MVSGYDPNGFPPLRSTRASRPSNRARTPRVPTWSAALSGSRRASRWSGPGGRPQRGGRARSVRRQHAALAERPPIVADRRHADRYQGSARDERHADPDGLRGLCRKFSAARQRGRVGAAPGRGRRARQDGDGGTRWLAARADHQSVQPRAYAGRLFLGVGRGRRRRHGAGRDRHPGRRFDHPGPPVSAATTR